MDMVNSIVNFRRFLKMRNYSAHTVKNYLSTLERFVLWLDIPIEQVTPKRVEAYIDGLLTKGLSAKTINCHLDSIRRFYDYLHDEEGIELSNPVKRGYVLRLPKPLPRHLKDHEVKWLFAVIESPRDRAIFVILAADPDKQDYLWTIALTIARMSEINRLTWEDVNFKDRYVLLWTRKSRGGHWKPRKVPMPNKLYAILLRRFQNRDKRVPWVFWHRYWSSKQGKWVVGPYLERKRIMQTLCKKTGVKYFRYHALRHLGASLLDGAKRPLGEIQRILGHENRKTTELYLHSLNESEREAMEVFDLEFAEENSHTFSHTKQKKDSGEFA